MAHVVIVGSYGKSLTIFRGDLIRSIVAGGHRVTAMAASATLDTVRELEIMGAEFQPFALQRSGLNPVRDLIGLVRFYFLLRRLAPDVVFSYTAKPIIWSGLALSFSSHANFFALVTGLGYGFTRRTWRTLPIRVVVMLLYAASLRRATSVIFQNADDLDTFVRLGTATATRCRVVAGSGVSLTHFAASEMPSSPPVFLLVARLLKSKGLLEYALAAKIVQQKYPLARFQLLGPEDPSPDRIELAEVRAWQAAGSIEYLGEVDDVRDFIAKCHMFVLPSYGEGMPRSVLEAMAMARPVLTTRAHGCRETVKCGENGFLVPVGDAGALAERMIWFIEHPDQWSRMGVASRRLAEEWFDVRKVNLDLMRIMRLDGAD